jgi:hypothetical protein
MLTKSSAGFATAQAGDRDHDGLDAEFLSCIALRSFPRKSL